MTDLFESYQINLVKKQNDTYPLNKIVQNFQSSISFPQGTKIALSSMSMYYSWRNITASNNNNTLSYIDTDSKTQTVTFQDGFYSISDIQGFLEYTMKANGDYLLDGDSKEVYFIKIESNTVYNCFTVTMSAVPSALPSGYTNPASMTLPVSATTLTLVIPATNIRYNLGYNAQSIPSTPNSTTYQLNSDFTPQITSITSVYLHSSLVNNSFFNPGLRDVLFSFTPDVPYGNLLHIQPSNLLFSPVFSPSSFSAIDITFTDQNNKDLEILDYNYQVNLVIYIPNNVSRKLIPT
jgi:hypothetical protein